MIKSNSYDYYIELLCKSKFNRVVNEIDENFLSQCDCDVKAELLSLKANAYLELSQQDKAIECLKTIINEVAHPQTDLQKYYMGRMAYMDTAWDQAAEIFANVLEITKSVRLRIKASLGLAIVYLTMIQSNKAKIGNRLEIILADLKELESEMDSQDKISYLILVGNCLKAKEDTTLEEVTTCFYHALNISSEKEWNYCQARSLYALSVAYEKFGKIDKMHTTLEILRAMVKKDEQIFFARIVNTAFERYEFKIALPLQFEESTQRIKLVDNWILLNERPLLYKFIETIYKDSSFVSKSDVAKMLWPEQEYKPRIHDPRIFDLAKRTRQILKQNSTSNLALLSNRQGYKLGNDIFQTKEAS